jgi:hypothetical protein
VRLGPLNALDRRPAQSARQRLTVALDRGTSPDPEPHAARCAALAAAALGNATVASVLIRGIAANQAAFRVWATHTGGMTGSAVLRRGLFPWSRVEDDPAFAAAVRTLEEAYAKARRQIAVALDDIE